MNAEQVAFKTIIDMNDLTLELEKDVKNWVRSTFNEIPLPILEGYLETKASYIFEHVKLPEPSDVLEEFLDSQNPLDYIKKFNDAEEAGINPDDFTNASSHKFFTAFEEIYGKEVLESFKEWCSDNIDDIQDFIQEEYENYPAWSTLFEFNDSLWNDEDVTKHCMDLGIGVLEGVDHMNNILFMTSAGHSFYSAYWIPLFLKTHDWAREKYAGVDYRGL